MLDRNTPDQAVTDWIGSLHCDVQFPEKLRRVSTALVRRRRFPTTFAAPYAFTAAATIERAGTAADAPSFFFFYERWNSIDERFKEWLWLHS